MGYFRFHRSIGNKFFRLNVSKNGFSSTVGVPGLHLNTPLIGKRRRRSMLTVGLPGSGLSYRQNIGRARGGVSRTEEHGVGEVVSQFLQLVIYVIIGISIILALGAL
jgi:hypothetical protein